MQYKDGANVQRDGLLQGFDGVVWAVAFGQALGGLIVAVVIKYADNILKAFATSIAIIVACAASVFIFAQWPTFMFLVGAALVIGAVVLYSVFPYKPRYFLTAQAEEEGADKNAVPLQGGVVGAPKSNADQTAPA